MALTMAAGAKAEPSNWTHNGVPLEESAEVLLSGGFGYTGGTQCWNGVAAVLEAEPGSTGTITSFEVTTPLECVVTGMIKATGCTQVTSVTANELPWTAHNTGSAIVITNFNITLHYKGGPLCFPFYQIGGTLELVVPPERKGFEDFWLDGDLKLFGAQSIILEGTMSGRPQDVATYGL